MLDLVPETARQFSERVRASIHDFTGREWLLAELTEWWDRGDQRICLLIGDPGTGKSMMLAWLLGLGPEPDLPIAKAHLARLREAARAAHICRASSRNITPGDFARNVSAQLAQTLPGYKEALEEELRERITIIGRAVVGVAGSAVQVTGVSVTIDLGGLRDEKAFDQGFVDPLKRFASRDPSDPILLLVDALDEAQTYEDALLPRLLAQNDDWPAGVRLIMTIRDEPRILKFYKDARLIYLSQKNDQTLVDIRAFVESGLAASRIGTPDARREFAKRLSKQANGLFLYAALVIEQLRASPPEHIPDMDAIILPQGLEGIYHEYLNRELGQNDNRWFELFEPLLGLLTVARGEGLTADQLSKITGRDIRAALRASQQYLSGEPPQGPFRPFHKSFSDFLLKTKQEYTIDPLLWHRCIADHYIKHYKHDWQSCDTYGLHNVPAHLQAAGCIAELLALIDRNWVDARVRRAEFIYGGLQSDLDLAWNAAVSAAGTGIDDLIRIRSVGYVIQEQIAAFEDEDLPLMAALGRREEAIGHIRLRKAPRARFAGYRKLIIDSADEPAITECLIQEARMTIRTDDPLQQIDSLCQMIKYGGDAGRRLAPDMLAEAEHQLDQLNDVERSSKAKCSIGEVLAYLGLLDEAFAMANDIGDDLHRAFALSSVARLAAQQRVFEQAEIILKVLEGLTKGNWIKSAILRIHAETLIDIARELCIAGDPRGTAMFHRGLAAAGRPEEVYDRCNAYSDLIEALVAVGRLEEAESVLERITDWQADKAICTIAVAYGERGDLDRTLTLLSHIKESRFRSTGQLLAVPVLAKAGLLKPAIELLNKISDRAARGTAAARLFQALVHRCDPRAMEMLDRAQQEAHALSDKDKRKVLTTLCRAAIKTANMPLAQQLFDKATAGRSGASDPADYARALRQLVAALAAANEGSADTIFSAASDALSQVDSTWRSSEHRALAACLIETGRLDEAQALLETADLWSGRYEAGRYEEWVLLSSALSGTDPDRAADALERGLGVLEKYNDSARQDACIKVTDMLVKQRQLAAIDRLLRDIDSKKDSKILCRLAIALHAADPARAATLFRLTEEGARVQWDAYDRDEQLRQLSVGLAKVRLFDEALRIAKSIAKGGHRIAALAAVASRLANVNDPRGVALLDEAVLIAAGDNIPDDWREIDDLREKANALDRDGTVGADALRAEARRRAGSDWKDWSWGVETYRARSLGQIAVALLRAGDTRFDGIMESTLAAAADISHERTRDEELLALLRALLEIGRRDVASTILHGMRGEDNRSSAIRDLVNACLLDGESDEALRLARLESNEFFRREIVRSVAVALAQQNRMTDGLVALEDISLDRFIESVCSMLIAWKKAPHGKIIECLCVMIMVAGWVRPDWNEIAGRLQCKVVAA